MKYRRLLLMASLSLSIFSVFAQPGPQYFPSQVPGVPGPPMNQGTPWFNPPQTPPPAANGIGWMSPNTVVQSAFPTQNMILPQWMRSVLLRGEMNGYGHV